MGSGDLERNKQLKNMDGLNRLVLETEGVDSKILIMVIRAL